MGDYRHAHDENALAVTAHCDDAELWAGGTIRLWADTGTKVSVAIAHSTPERRREAQEAAGLLGHCAVFREAEEPLDRWIARLFEEIRPEVLLCHSIKDPHFEHSELHAAVIKALTRSNARKAYPKRWWTFDTYYLSQQPSSAPLLIDISNTFEHKVRALGCHRSQNPEELIRMARLINGLNGMRIRVSSAEAFHPFDLLGRLPAWRELP